MSKSLALVISTVVYDFCAVPKPHTHATAKVECESVEGLVGGAGPHIANAMQRVLESTPTLALIMAQDQYTNLLTAEIGMQHSCWHGIMAADFNRLTLDVPPDPKNPGCRRLYTTRSNIDAQLAMHKLTPLVDEHPWVFLGALSENDHQLAAAILDRVAQEHGRSYLMLSARQLANRRQALDLACRCDLLHVNGAELDLLAGPQGDVGEKMSRLTDQGVRGLIVTLGANGMRAQIDGQQYEQPAFDVPMVRDTSAGDMVAGTVLAGWQEGFEPPEYLRLAAAAGAMQVANLPRQGGWNELRDFARVTPILCPRASQSRRVVPTLKLPQSVRHVAAGVVAGIAASITVFIGIMMH